MLKKYKVQHKYGSMIVEANDCRLEGNVVRFFKHINANKYEGFLAFSLFNLIYVEDISDGIS